MNAALGRGDVAANVAATFATKTAAATGRSQRAVQRDAERGDSITVERPAKDPGRWISPLSAAEGP
jgi:hypothetical protein